MSLKNLKLKEIFFNIFYTREGGGVLKKSYRIEPSDTKGND